MAGHLLSEPSHLRPGRTWTVAACAAALFAVIAVDYFSVFFGAFLADARFLILENHFVRDIGLLWDNLTHDYFWSSSGNSLPYWRPLTKAQWVLLYQLFGESAGGYHALQLVWFGFGAVGVLLLARHLVGDLRMATCAALIWSLSPVAIEPVHLLMAGSDVVAGSCAVWCVYFLARFCEGGGRAFAVGHTLCWILGLASKEVAIMLLPLFLGISLSRPQTTRRALSRCLPSVVIAAAYLVLRSLIVDGTVALDWNLKRSIVSLGLYLWGLFPLHFDSSVRSVSMAEASHAATWAKVLLACGSVTTIAIWAWRRRARWPLLCCGWILLVLMPVVLVAQLNVPGVAGKFALADRWAFHAVAPTVLLFVWLVARLPHAPRWLMLACALWAPTALILHRPEHSFYRSERRYLDKETFDYEQTPPHFRTPQDRCRAIDREAQALLRAGQIERGARLLEQQRPNCGETSLRNFNLLAAYMSLRRFEQAKPIAQRLLRDGPKDARSHATLSFFLGKLALLDGRLGQAQNYLKDAAHRGYRGCDLHAARAKLSVVQHKHGQAAQRFARAARCYGASLSGAKSWLAASWAWRAAKVTSRATQALQAARSVPLDAGDQKTLTELLRRGEAN